jgi:hypothetical protein
MKQDAHIREIYPTFSLGVGKLILFGGKKYEEWKTKKGKCERERKNDIKVEV